MSPAPLPPPAPAAVVLAAGSGSRLGTVPKSLLELDGVPLIRRLVLALQAAGVFEVVVVLGHHAHLIETALSGLDVKRVLNPRPDDGAVSSQRLGLAAIEGAAACIVALADQPLVDAADIRALVQAFESHRAEADVLFPQVLEQRGNPVIFSQAVRADILRADAHFGCRQWQAANPQRVLPWNTDNRHYVIDIDTPGDVQKFEREHGRALRWAAAAWPVLHNAALQRFEVQIDGQLATCDYRRAGDVLALVHTGVPSALEGRGIAAALVGAAMSCARQANLRVRPVCSYVAAYMRRHPETSDLLAPPV